jgi:hypothetical protein
VAEQKTLAQRTNASPQKLALIGVLAVILLGVLYIQFAGSGGEELNQTERIARADRRPNRSPANGKGDAKTAAKDGKSPEFLLESVDRRQWKSPALEEIVRYDPFALPAAFPQPVVATTVPGGKGLEGVVVAADTEIDLDTQAKSIAEMQAKLVELQQRGVRVIIQGKKQATAVIGDRTVRVGDDVDGFTVKAIQSDGVVVERKLE